MTYLLLGLAAVAAFLYRDRLLGSGSDPVATPAAPSHPLHTMLSQVMDNVRAITIETANTEAENARRRVLAATLSGQVAAIAGQILPTPASVTPAQPPAPPSVAETPRPN